MDFEMADLVPEISHCEMFNLKSSIKNLHSVWTNTCLAAVVCPARGLLQEDALARAWAGDPLPV